MLKPTVTRGPHNQKGVRAYWLDHGGKRALYRTLADSKISAFRGSPKPEPHLATVSAARLAVFIGLIACALGPKHLLLPRLVYFAKSLIKSNRGPPWFPRLPGY